MLTPESLADCICGRPVVVAGEFVGCQRCRPSLAETVRPSGWTFVRHDSDVLEAYLVSSPAGSILVSSLDVGAGSVLFSMAREIVAARASAPADRSVSMGPDSVGAAASS